MILKKLQKHQLPKQSKKQKNKNEKLFDDDFFGLLNNNIFFGEIKFNPALISKPIQPQNKEESKDKDNNNIPLGLSEEDKVIYFKPDDMLDRSPVFPDDNDNGLSVNYLLGLRPTGELPLITYLDIYKYLTDEYNHLKNNGKI